MSGSIHYFRVPRELWQDRLRRIRSGGFNAIQFVIPWNIHEPFHGKFDFNANNDINAFIELAEQEDLFVLLRPGPYICAGLIKKIYSHSDRPMHSGPENFKSKCKKNL